MPCGAASRSPLLYHKKHRKVGLRYSSRIQVLYYFSVPGTPFETLSARMKKIFKICTWYTSNEREVGSGRVNTYRSIHPLYVYFDTREDRDAAGKVFRPRSLNKSLQQILLCMTQIPPSYLKKLQNVSLRYSCRSHRSLLRVTLLYFFRNFSTFLLPV